MKHVSKNYFQLQYVAQNYALDGVLTLVDAKHIGQHLDERKPEGVVNEALSQVAYADRIILNKTDLVRCTNTSPSPKICSFKCSIWAYNAIFNGLVMLTKLGSLLCNCKCMTSPAIRQRVMVALCARQCRTVLMP